MEKTKKEVEGGLEDTKKGRKVRVEGLGEGGLEERKKEKEAHNVVNLYKQAIDKKWKVDWRIQRKKEKLEWKG